MLKQYNITLGTIIMKMFVSAIFQILFSMKALFKGQAKRYFSYCVLQYFKNTEVVRCLKVEQNKWNVLARRVLKDHFHFFLTQNTH